MFLKSLWASISRASGVFWSVCRQSGRTMPETGGVTIMAYMPQEPLFIRKGDPVCVRHCPTSA